MTVHFESMLVLKYLAYCCDSIEMVHVCHLSFIKAEVVKDLDNSYNTESIFKKRYNIPS